MLLDDLEKALFVLPSWGSGNASAEIIRFEGEDAEKAFEARKLKNSRNGCATYIRVKLTGDRLVLVVPKQEPHGFNPISPSKVLCELFAAEVDPNGYSVTFDKASAAAVKDHFAEADKADVGADAIGLTAAGSMASAPTNPGVASMNPDVMEEPPQSRRVVEAECALEAAEDDADATAEELAEARLRVDAECDLALALALDGSWEKGRKCNASEDDVGAKVTALGGLMLYHDGQIYSYTPEARVAELDEFLLGEEDGA